MFDLDLSLRNLRAAEGAAVDDWVVPVDCEAPAVLAASLELATLRLLLRQGDLSFSLLGTGDWASVGSHRD